MRSEKFLRYIIDLINLFIMVFGVWLIAFGGIMISDLVHISNGRFNTHTIPIFTIILGTLIVVSTIFGVYAAYKKKHYWCRLYAIILILLIFLQISYISWLYIIEDSFIHGMAETVNIVYRMNIEGNGNLMDDIQTKYDCCGINNYIDYTNSSIAVPTSCCCTLAETYGHDSYVNLPGCKTAIVAFWRSNIGMLHEGCIFTSVFEAIASVLVTVFLYQTRDCPYN